jgi:hypothetical protein
MKHLAQTLRAELGRSTGAGGVTRQADSFPICHFLTSLEICPRIGLPIAFPRTALPGILECPETGPMPDGHVTHEDSRGLVVNFGGKRRHELVAYEVIPYKERVGAGHVTGNQ